MNAYELADQVEMWGEDLLALNMKGGIPVVQGAKMLRQQADRITHLEMLVANRNEIIDKLDLKPQTKPLSDEEINKLIVNKVTDYELCRAIEKRHGIK